MTTRSVGPKRLSAHPSAGPGLPFVERRQRERRKSKRRGPAPGQVASHHINHVHGGVGSGNLPTGLVDAISATSHEGSLAPGIPEVNRNPVCPLRR